MLGQGGERHEAEHDVSAERDPQRPKGDPVGVGELSWCVRVVGNDVHVEGVEQPGQVPPKMAEADQRDALVAQFGTLVAGTCRPVGIAGEGMLVGYELAKERPCVAQPESVPTRAPTRRSARTNRGSCRQCAHPGRGNIGVEAVAEAVALKLAEEAQAR